MRVLPFVGLALMIAFAVPTQAKAQILYGSITGNVTDASGGAAPGAEVTITQSETNFTRTVSTNEAGIYSFAAVPAGTYEIQITLAGFKAFVSSGVPVTVNNTSRINAVLEVGAVTESVTVTSEATLLQTDKSDIRLELPDVGLRNLPVPLNRNYQSLFKTLPGFTPPGRAHSIQTNPSRSLRFNVNGVSDSINNTKIDGASATNPWLPHITSYVPSLEAIQTVSIVTNSFDAEQGLAGGAAINVQIKSGTNEYHGSVYAYHDDHTTRARPFFLPSDQGKAKWIYNQVGGTIGGPVKKDKLWFFSNFEFTGNRRLGFRTGSVPTAAVRSGDFSGFFDPDDPDPTSNGTLFNPLTGNPDGTGRLPFAGNVISPAMHDPIAQQIIGMVPMPNLNRNADGTYPESRNYIGTGNFVWDRSTWDSKVDWNASDNLNLFGRFSLLDYSVTQPTIFGNDGLVGDGLSTHGAGGGNPGTGRGTTTTFSVGVNYLFSPTFIMDANFGYIRFVTDSRNPYYGENVGLDVLGIPGTNGPSVTTDGSDYKFQGGFPQFDLSGYDDYGNQQDYMPYLRKDPVYQYTANFTKTKGSHEIRWGLDMVLQQMNHIQPEFTGGWGAGPFGRFNFRNDLVRLRTYDPIDDSYSTSSAPSRFSFATFLMGMPERVGKNFLTEAPYDTSNWNYSFYVRDRWQITPQFTLSYGTRWEYFPIPTRGERGLERYDPTTNMMLIGGIGSVPMDTGVSVSKADFAPRIGLTYRVSEAVVIRAGYGITNDPYPLSRPMRTNYPVLIESQHEPENSWEFIPGWDPALGMANGIPPITPPGLGNGVIPIPATYTANTLPTKFERGYVQSWNFILQSKLAQGFVGEVGYVASRQIRQLGMQRLNWADIGMGSAGRQLAWQYGRTGDTRMAMPIGGSHYDSLQARLTRRFSNGHMLDMSYTWGKSMSNSGQNNSDGTLDVNIPHYYHLNRRVSGFNRAHNFQVTNVSELPFGKGRRWLADKGVLSALVGGWQVNNILSFYSGTPFTIESPSGVLNAPGNSQTADQIGPIRYLGGIGPGQTFFDTSSFAEVTEERFGTSGRNIMRGPGVAHWDFGIDRKFKLAEGKDLLFRVQAFNFTNTPHFGNPEGAVDDDEFGEVSGIDASAGVERIFRFALRLSW